MMAAPTQARSERITHLTTSRLGLRAVIATHHAKGSSPIPIAMVIQRGISNQRESGLAATKRTTPVTALNPALAARVRVRRCRDIEFLRLLLHRLLPHLVPVGSC